MDNVYQRQQQSSVSCQYHQSTLDRQLIGISINTWSTSQSTISRESTNFCRHIIKCRSIHMSWMILGQLLTDCQSSVDRALTKLSQECQSNVSQVLIKMLIEKTTQRNHKATLCFFLNIHYNSSTNNTLDTVPPSRSMSLVSELEQISSNAKSSSSSEISNIWRDIKQNTHQVRPYLKGKRNLKLKDKQAADIALSEIHSLWFIWKTIRSTHSFNKVWLLVNHHESSSSKILSARQLVVAKF